MSKYRFVGIEAEIVGVVRLDRFGQIAEIPDGMEREAAAALCIPAETFDGIFVAGDAETYAMPASHADAPKDFKARKRAAAIAVIEFRQQTQTQAKPATKGGK